MQRLYPLILLFSLLLCSCHDDVPVQPGSTVARRTVLIYMAAPKFAQEESSSRLYRNHERPTILSRQRPSAPLYRR